MSETPKKNEQAEPILTTENEVVCGPCFRHDHDRLVRVLLHRKFDDTCSGVCPECGQRYVMLPDGGR